LKDGGICVAFVFDEGVMVADEITAGRIGEGGGGSKDEETTTLQPDGRFGAPHAVKSLTFWMVTSSQKSGVFHEGSCTVS